MERPDDGIMKSGPEPFLFAARSYTLRQRKREGAWMRILLILIVIAAVIVVVRAQSRDCKYDATLINCVLGKSEMPAAETPPAPETPAPETPAPEAPAPEAPAQ